MSKTVRYYYTDPLAAAFMAKHFGMKMDLPIYGASVDVAKIQHVLAKKSPYKIERLYIHPDSLHLLDVQYGDLTLDDDPMDYGHRWLDVSTSAYMRKNYNRIIQRNGIPFHWPEVENE